MKELTSIQNLIDSFSKLPGVGVKSAERMAYAVLNFEEDDRRAFADAIAALSSKIHKCPECGLYTENDELCDICLDEERDHKVICVVSEIKDAYAIEKMNTFKGFTIS